MSLKIFLRVDIVKLISLIQLSASRVDSMTIINNYFIFAALIYLFIDQRLLPKVGYRFANSLSRGSSNILGELVSILINLQLCDLYKAERAKSKHTGPNKNKMNLPDLKHSFRQGSTLEFANLFVGSD